MPTHRFRGRIAGFGSTSGVRVVIGRWDHSPFGRFADAMVAEPDGRRVLLAPTRQVADFVSGTYVFDEIRVEPLLVTDADTGPDGAWTLESDSLTVTVRFGRRTPLGRLLRVVPRPVATSTTFATLADPIARVVLPGVRTRGIARTGRTEWYGAHDVHDVVGIDGEYVDRDLGRLAPVDPPPAFGFSSTPKRPSVTSVVTTIRDDPAR